MHKFSIYEPSEGGVMPAGEHRRKWLALFALRPYNLVLVGAVRQAHLPGRYCFWAILAKSIQDVGAPHFDSPIVRIGGAHQALGIYEVDVSEICAVYDAYRPF